MNIDTNQTEARLRAIAIGVWENEGGAPGSDSTDHHYGRRIEADRSWSVYHVFTGVPARAAGSPMIGLSRSDATSRMLSLNIHHDGLRRERGRLMPRAVIARKIEAVRSCL